MRSSRILRYMTQKMFHLGVISKADIGERVDIYRRSNMRQEHLNISVLGPTFRLGSIALGWTISKKWSNQDISRTQLVIESKAKTNVSQANRKSIQLEIHGGRQHRHKPHLNWSNSQGLRPGLAGMPNCVGKTEKPLSGNRVEKMSKSNTRSILMTITGTLWAEPRPNRCPWDFKQIQARNGGEWIVDGTYKF